MFGLASLCQITANILVQMYATFHQDTYVPDTWHVFVAYLCVLWIATFFVIFANRLVPYTQSVGMFVILVGGIVTIIVISAMNPTHASNHFVWGSFEENNCE